MTISLWPSWTWAYCISRGLHITSQIKLLPLARKCVCVCVCVCASWNSFLSCEKRSKRENRLIWNWLTDLFPLHCRKTTWQNRFSTLQVKQMQTLLFFTSKSVLFPPHVYSSHTSTTLTPSGVHNQGLIGLADVILESWLSSMHSP